MHIFKRNKQNTHLARVLMSAVNRQSL